MEMRLIRTTFTEASTIGELWIGDERVCFILEDTDRGLASDMPLEVITHKKQRGVTAIPAGRYEVVVNRSPKFGRDLPLLLDVPGFEGIRIHSGNTPADTLGCLLPGGQASDDFVGGSRVAFRLLFAKINAALQHEQVFITISRLGQARAEAFALTMSVQGKMSTFGGPDDHDIRPDEGLALCNESDLGEEPFNTLFLPAQPPGTSGLARRLNPEARYVAVRWDYDKTPKLHLRAVQVKVENVRTGAFAFAIPVDRRPSPNSGRIADLSPGLARELGLETDDVCRVTVPLP